MRKVLRAKLRHQAEKSNGKTIRVFKSLWKSELDKRNPVKDIGTKMVKKKKQSILKRTIKKTFRKKGK